MVSSQPHAAASLESRLSEPEHEGRAVCPQSSPHTPRGLAEPSGRSRATAPLLPASSHHLRRATPQAFAQTRGAGNSGGVASGPWAPALRGTPSKHEFETRPSVRGPACPLQTGVHGQLPPPAGLLPFRPPDSGSHRELRALFWTWSLLPARSCLCAVSPR